MALRKSNNWAFVEGKLAEVDLEEAEYQGQPCIRGNYTVRVEQEVEGKVEVSDIQIHAFAKELTNAGKANKAYADLHKILHEYRSIASSSLEEADTIRSSGGQATMNEYFTQDGRFVSFERIMNNFADRVNNKPESRAYANIEGYIAEMGYRLDREMVETDVFEVKVVNIDYAGRASVIPLITSRKNIAEAIQNTFDIGTTIEVSAFIRNVVEVEEVFEEVEIGDPIASTRTRRSSGFVISSAKATTDDLAYSDEEISEALKKRTEDLQTKRDKAVNSAPKTTERAAPKKGVSRIDLGF